MKITKQHIKQLVREELSILESQHRPTPLDVADEFRASTFAGGTSTLGHESITPAEVDQLAKENAWANLSPSEKDILRAAAKEEILRRHQLLPM